MAEFDSVQSSASDVFWATEESQKVVEAATERVHLFRQWLQYTGRENAMRRNWSAYAGFGPSGDKLSKAIQYGGAQGEILELNVNQFAALLNQVVVLTTSQKPAVKCVASNNDFRSVASTITGDAVLEHYDRELETAEHEAQAVRDMYLLSEAWSVLAWDQSLGRPLMPDETGRVLHEGDLAQYNLTSFDVAYNPKISDERRTWVVWRRPIDKWELAAQFPDKREDILAAQSETPAEKRWEWRKVDGGQEFDKDTVYLWELRHKRTPACPNGRLIQYLSNECILFDSMRVNPETGEREDYGYPYGDDLFAYRIVPELMPGSGDPHTLFFDLLSQQEGLDLAATIMASAVNAAGLSNWLVPDEGGIVVEALSGGLNVIKYKGGPNGKPELSKAIEIPASIGEWADRCVSWMRQRSAVNDVVMGETKAGMPAQMAALLRAEAIEYHSAGQRSYERFIQRHRSGQIKLLQKYATSERVARIVGKGGQWAVKEWSKDKLAQVDSVQVEPVSAASRSYAGRLALADTLLDKGLVEDAQQYINVIETGRVDPVMRYAIENKARIQAERELLMQGVGLPPIATDATGMPLVGDNGLPLFVDGGEYVRPLKCDSHDTDIREYQAILSSPQVRGNQQVITAVLDVIDYKMRLWQSLTPDELVVYHLPPLPSQTGMMPPPPGQEAPPPPPTDEPRGDSSPAEIAADGVDPERPITSPKPPPNPLTGDQQGPPI